MSDSALTGGHLTVKRPGFHGKSVIRIVGLIVAVVIVGYGVLSLSQRSTCVSRGGTFTFAMPNVCTGAVPAGATVVPMPSQPGFNGSVSGVQPGRIAPTGPVQQHATACMAPVGDRCP